MTPQPTLSVGRGLGYISIAAVAWGTGGVAAAVLYSSGTLGPIAVSFWRFAAGVVALGVIRLLRRRRAAPRPRLGMLAVTGTGLAVSQASYFASVRYSGIAVATIVTIAAGPIITALGSRVLLGERIGRLSAITIALAVIGLVALVGSGTRGPASGLGLAYAALSAVSYAALTMYARHRANDGTDPIASALGGFTLGMLFLLPVALWEGVAPAPGHPVRTVAMIVYLGAVPTAAAYGLFFAGLASVRATTASVIVLLEPVTATLLAMIAFGERLTAVSLAGGVLLLTAVAALGRSELAPDTERILTTVEETDARSPSALNSRL